jgi:two-component system cell cycle response regulator
MRSDRPYQMMLTEDQAREQVRKGRGSQFDPDVADLFLDLHSRGLVGDLRQVRPNGQANPASVRAAAAVVSPK